MKITYSHWRLLFYGGFLALVVLISVVVPGFAWRKPDSIRDNRLPGVTDLIYFATDAPDNFIIYSPAEHETLRILPGSERMSDMIISDDGTTVWTSTKSGYVDRFEIPQDDHLLTTATTLHTRIAPVLSSVAVSASGRFVAVGYGNTEDYNSRAVKILPADTLSLADQLAEFTVSGDIQDIVANPARDLFYIINSHSDRVRIYNAATFRLESDILELGNSPGQFVIRPDGTRGYGAMNARMTIAVVDLVTNETIDNIGLNYSPYAMCFSPDGNRLYVASRDTSDVSIIDLDTNEILTTFKFVARQEGVLEFNFAEIIAVSSDENYMYVMPKRPELLVYDISGIVEYLYVEEDEDDEEREEFIPEMVQSEILAATPFHMEVVRRAGEPVEEVEE